MANKKVLTPEEFKAILDACYEKAIGGIPMVSKPIDDMAIEYLDRYPSKRKALKKMINMQTIKCTTTGFVTSLGGLITLPIAVPADLGSVLYVQLRMIACSAYMSGYDITSDEVRTLTYACLAGVTVNEVIKQTGVKVGEKITVSLIKKIPGEVFAKINKAVGFRFITKFGEKGLINLGKLVPGVGGVVGGGLNFAETKVIGNRAYKWFMLGDFSGDDKRGKEKFSEDIIETDCTEV